jgi:restriction endonuclease Mrr
VESGLLQQVKSASPAFFERLVVDLLVKMGYGGNHYLRIPTKEITHSDLMSIKMGRRSAGQLYGD